jgi:hypothetical protein
LNDNGTAVEEVDNSSDANEGDCTNSGGTWLNGNIDPNNVAVDPNSNWVGETNNKGQITQAACVGNAGECSSQSFGAWDETVATVVVYGNRTPDQAIEGPGQQILADVNRDTRGFNSVITCAAGVASPFLPGVNPFEVVDMVLGEDGKEQAGNEAATKGAEATESAAERAAERAEEAADKARRWHQKSSGFVQEADRASTLAKGAKVAGKALAIGQAIHNAKEDCKASD